MNTVESSAKSVLKKGKNVDILIISRTENENATEPVSLSDRLFFITAGNSAQIDHIYASLPLKKTLKERGVLLWRNKILGPLVLRIVPAFIPDAERRRRFRNDAKTRWKW